MKASRLVSSSVKWLYKTLRSIVFTLALVVVGLYVLIYTLFSIPTFTNLVKDRAARELSAFLGARVEIDDLDIYPFNEVKISGIKVFDPSGNLCLSLETLGGGISLAKLITEGNIVLTYGEVIGLEAYVEQPEKEAPLNIDFIIKAFSPKEKKEKKPFELSLRNVVLRKSSATFSRPWIGSDHKIGNLDLSYLRVTELAADISFPKISDSGIEVDLRRLSLSVPEVIDIEKIGLKGSFSTDSISVSDLVLEFPSSRIYIPAIEIFAENGDFAKVLRESPHKVQITGSYITPSDFSSLLPLLKEFQEPLYLELLASGTPEAMEIENFRFGNPSVLSLTFQGGAEGFLDPGNLAGDISDLNLAVSSATFNRLDNLLPNLPHEIRHALSRLGDLKLTGDFAGNMSNRSLKGHVEAESEVFRLEFEGGIENFRGSSFQAQGELNIEEMRLQELLPKVPVGDFSANIIAEGNLSGGDPEGMLSLVVDDFIFKGKSYDGFSLNLSKEGGYLEGDLLMSNAIAEIESRFSGRLEGEEKSLRLDMDLDRLDLSELTDMKKYDGYIISGSINLDAEARSINDLTGELSLNNFTFASPASEKRLSLRSLKVEATAEDSLRSLNLKSDWVDIRAEGPFKAKDLPAQLQALGASVFPALLRYPEREESNFTSDVDFDILIKKNNSVPEFFNLPVRLLVPVTISGSIEGSTNSANITFDFPYLQQGKYKLIYDTKLIADIDGTSGELNALIETNVPVKRGDLSLNVNLYGHANSLSTDIHWMNTENRDFNGHLILDTDFRRNELSAVPDIRLLIQPTVMHLGTADWNLGRSEIAYNGNSVTIDGLRLWHDNQFVEVNGKASSLFSDVVTVTLEDIDVDYVFDMLQINYVTFGGTATGEIAGHALLSEDPVAETESLNIRNFTYNGAPLGVCVATSRWNNEEKEIEIGAKISKDDRLIVDGSGGIWIGNDSLSFNISAKKVPVEFVQPFMSVFSSHVGGFATGDVHLFGNFHDIDMTGKIFADSVAVKLDYTNTVYHGSDSVILHPGKIEIPHFRLYDKFGNSALLTGELTHKYFHDPAFTFRLSDASNFLCYDTNRDLNPEWYGTLFGTGSANLIGVPGQTDISADMTVSGNSDFTFVLSDAQYARDYQFLTFSDRRAEEARKNRLPTTGDLKEMLRQHLMESEAGISKFGIDIRASVTPEVLFTLVMDPATGDKINARGRGAMQVKYESDDDEMLMYGKYEITEGNYNFSLQDIILRDFKIKEGSYISFNGNPLAADLDISATYRVNTNLSDLDKSFSTDRDLNRTNVPVDAVLTVTGNMTSPDITFDIELPTLTQDVERKVKSIISTDDMMNRQIIYLLALNRFYTPEYMGASGNGGELAAVASSTISSQLSNMLGQLTDKFSVSPSFRSDKGDFSDIEVDVALSSRLLNNRLLINGNFGYRDRSNSSTTFVGDFDVEYLLSKNGNLRLKAYNHFNDQNYYLREALTTQGLGIVYRKDFDDWFKFLRKRK